MAFPIDRVFEDEDLQGPGWLVFFTEIVRVIPARGGGQGVAAQAEVHITEDLDLDDDEIIDIVSLLALSGIIE